VREAIVLLSGGLDSVTAVAWAKTQDFNIQKAYSFTYGQKHVKEIESAKAVAAYYGLNHEIVALAPISGSRLTDSGDIPLDRDLDRLNETIAPTYVPNRNMIMLSYAAAYALLGTADHIIGGWNGADALNYPDCREEFLAATENTLRLATLRPFNIVRPLINDLKPAIAKKAVELNAPLHLTWTCYVGGEKACGKCDACQLRIAAFKTIGAKDPIEYEIEV
jgi:7-cyano-7-deazaguanine synthase